METSRVKTVCRAEKCRWLKFNNNLLVEPVSHNVKFKRSVRAMPSKKDKILAKFINSYVHLFIYLGHDCKLEDFYYKCLQITFNNPRNYNIDIGNNFFYL